MSIDIEEFDLDTLRIDVDYAQVTGNLRVGIKQYGIAQSSQCAFSLSIKSTSDAVFSAGISSDIQPPTNPLAVPLYDGMMILNWTPPDCKYAYFEVFGCLTENGQYIPFLKVVGATGAVVKNLPLEASFFLRVRTVHETGEASSFAQIKKGKLSTGNVTVAIRAINGSIIPGGALFSVMDSDTGILVSLETESDITITNATTVSFETSDLEIHEEELAVINDIVVYIGDCLEGFSDQDVVIEIV